MSDSTPTPPTPTHCPTCHAPLSRSADIVPNFTTLGCRACRKMAVEVAGHDLVWHDLGPGWLERLRAYAEAAGHMARLGSQDDEEGWRTLRSLDDQPTMMPEETVYVDDEFVRRMAAAHVMGGMG